MSYFVIGVGGTGAKLMQTLIHLSAAGLLPERGRPLAGMLVDPDENNGNVDSAKKLAAVYANCKRLQCGATDLFKNPVNITGAWTPISDPHVASLSTVFGYTRLRENDPEQADLMELLYAPEERELKIFEGFRGRPSIGAAIFGKSVNFRNGDWGDFRDDIRANAGTYPSVPVLLAGSVFGGSGAAGVPTLCRLLQSEFRGVANNLRLGLTLFLPYFTFRPVPGDPMQSDPHAFSTATAESLKYYDEGRFLEICHSIYAVGDETPAEMSVSAVGAGEQRNDPHYVELVAGLGAVRFMAGADGGDEHTMSIAMRQGAPDGGDQSRDTLRWQDLPTASGQHQVQTALLQRLALFAVVFHFRFYPEIVEDLRQRKPKHHFVITHMGKNPVTPDITIHELEQVNLYAEWFLGWLLKISLPGGRPEFEPGLVNPNVFAVPGEAGWRLKTPPPPGGKGEFQDRELGNLVLKAEGKLRPDMGRIWHDADTPVNDAAANGTGRLVRALYEACKIYF